MLFKYSVYLVFLFCYLTKSNNFLRRVLKHKIVGGNVVDIRNYPYMAKYGGYCGAAIISDKWALTAGHCNRYSDIFVGSKYSDKGTKVVVKDWFEHPGWSKDKKAHMFDYDFRLLELNESLRFNRPNIKPIKIARPQDFVPGKIVTVTGWGNTAEGGNVSYELRAVKVPIISEEICQKVPIRFFNGTLTPRMFCAGYKEGKKDACQGDSGGPAAADGRLYGAVSFGYGCATPDYYGVYSNVAEVRDWIMAITGLHLD